MSHFIYKRPPVFTSHVYNSNHMSKSINLKVVFDTIRANNRKLDNSITYRFDLNGKSS